MNNLISFINALLSYGFVYFVFIVCIIISITAGINMRKRKDAKDALNQVSESES